MSEKRLKIFISAYACEPEKGSEPGIGWNVVNELAKYHEVHVLTRANNRPSIEAALADREVKPVFHYYDLPKWLAFWKKKRRGYHLYYYLWQYGAYFKYCGFVNNAGFDIVQHLTFANFAMPSLFMFAKPLTVLGPIGRTGIPKSVWRSLPAKIRFKERLRGFTMWLMTHLDVCRVLTPVCADRILECGFPQGESGFPARWRNKIVRHPQTGINPDEPEYRCTRRRQEDGKTRMLICSEFLHWKGVTFAAEIYGRIATRRKDVELWIYGSGPEERNMRAIFAQHGVEDSVEWKGFVGKAEMMQGLFDSDILLYPSYHHGLATLILQAMYAGLPIVTIAGDPVAECVAEGGGLVADGADMAEMLDDLERKTLQLVEDHELRRTLGEREKTLVRERYDWRILCRRLSDILLEFAGGRR